MLNLDEAKQLLESDIPLTTEVRQLGKELCKELGDARCIIEELTDLEFEELLGKFRQREEESDTKE